MHIFWYGVTGLSFFLLLGQLFANFPHLQNGIKALFCLIAIGVFVVGALNIILYCARAKKFNLVEFKQTCYATGLVMAGVLGVLLAVMWIGGQ